MSNNQMIKTKNISDTHQHIRNIVKAYDEAETRLATITQTVKENWVGDGLNEFDVQYKILMSKMQDFGSLLDEIYDALVKAQAAYEEVDIEVSKQNQVAMEKGG